MTFALQMDIVPATNFGFVAASEPTADNGYWKTGLNK
jgi:hypothetical protein